MYTPSSTRSGALRSNPSDIRAAAVYCGFFSFKPPRIAPRHLFDVAVGDDNLFRGDKYKWSLRLTAINVTNKVGLYNFLSTFSRTHFVTPRTYTVELGFHF